MNHFTDYDDQVMRRRLRIAGYLGLDPKTLSRVDDADPDAHGYVEVKWVGVAPQLPTHGKCSSGIYQEADDLTRHFGTILLHPLDAQRMLAFAGPKPEFVADRTPGELDGLATRFPPDA